MRKWIKAIFRMLPWNIRDMIIFYKVFGRLPDLKTPKTFNEKTLCRKHHDCYTDSRFSLFADKYRVREYVSLKIGEHYLIPLIDVIDHVDQLDGLRGSLKDVVVKPTHGAGMVHFFDDVPSFQGLVEAKHIFQSWLDTDFADKSCEYQYKHIPRRLVVEQRLHGLEQHLTDYKFHLFRQPNGEFWFVLHIINGRFIGDLKHNFYINELSSPDLVDLKPQLQQAIDLSISLAGDIDYVRMDWYIVKGKLWFGEFTLTPAAGFADYLGEELDALMGHHWHYSKPVSAVEPAELSSV